LLLLQFSAVGDDSLQFSAIAGDRFRKEIPTQIDAHSQDMVIDRNHMIRYLSSEFLSSCG
jgi:hypothetical protein